MSTDVDICNLALSLLGDSATVASLTPPEGSAQAEHCAQFFPIAFAALMEAHPWSWATRRIALAPLEIAHPGWNYSYSYPADAARVLSVFQQGDGVGTVAVSTSATASTSTTIPSPAGLPDGSMLQVVNGQWAIVS